MHVVKGVCVLTHTPFFRGINDVIGINTRSFRMNIVFCAVFRRERLFWAVCWNDKQFVV